MGIRGAQPLGQDIADTGQFHDRAYPARRDNSGSFRCRAQDDLACAETPDHFVRDGSLAQRYPNQALFRALDTLANRFGDLVGLAETEPDQAVLVARDHQRAEAEAASALHDLGDAIDVDDLFLNFETLRINSIGHVAPSIFRTSVQLPAPRRPAP